MASDENNPGGIRDVVSRRRVLIVMAAGLGAVVSGCATTPAATSTPKPAATAAPTAAATSAPVAAATSAPTSAPTQAPAKLDFPAGRPINMLIGANPGGGHDITARTLQPYVEKTLGTTIVPVNKPAGGGLVMLSEAARAKPDGYTIFVLAVPPHTANWLDPSRKPDFKRTQFETLAGQMYDPGCILVRPDAPWKGIKDFVEAAKKEPGSISAALPPVLGDDHLFMLKIEAETGAKFTYVHNTGTAPAMTQFLGAHADVTACNESEAIPLVKRGDARILVMAHDKRTKYNPDIPTLIEQGINVTSYSTRGYALPVGTPRPIFEFLAKAFKDAITDPAFVKAMDEAGTPAYYLSPAEFLKVVEDEDDKMTKLAKANNFFEALPQK